jgi:hypothetical protein
MTQQQQWERYLLDLKIYQAKVEKFIWKLANGVNDDGQPSTQDGENPTTPLPPKPPTP